MSREIKFRAWHKRMAVMSNAVTLHTIAEKDYSLDFSDVVFLQYTGLKDKDGVEIYEGDFVRAFKPNTYLGPKDLLEVRWNSQRGCWAYWMLRINNWATGKGDVPMIVGENRSGRWCEVIGNRFENQELLEQKS